MGDGTKETKQIVSSWNRQKDKTTKVEKSVVKVKPQLVFQDKPDNSTLPFVPKLYEKVIPAEGQWPHRRGCHGGDSRRWPSI